MSNSTEESKGPNEEGTTEFQVEFKRNVSLLRRIISGQLRNSPLSEGTQRMIKDLIDKIKNLNPRRPYVVIAYPLASGLIVFLTFKFMSGIFDHVFIGAVSIGVYTLISRWGNTEDQKEHEQKNDENKITETYNFYSRNAITIIKSVGIAYCSLYLIKGIFTFSLAIGGSLVLLYILEKKSVRNAIKRFLTRSLRFT